MRVFEMQILTRPRNLIREPIPFVMKNEVEFLRAKQYAEYAAVHNESQARAIYT